MTLRRAAELADLALQEVPGPLGFIFHHSLSRADPPKNEAAEEKGPRQIGAVVVVVELNAMWGGGEGGLSVA